MVAARLRIPLAAIIIALTFNASAGVATTRPTAAGDLPVGRTNDCETSGGRVVSGATYCGHISSPGEEHTWTFTAQEGDRLGAQVGEIDGIASFYPLLRLLAPDGTSLASEFGTHAASVEVVASATGVYRVVIGSGDTGRAGTGTYRLTVINSSDPMTVSSDDEGRPLTSGAEHTGEIDTGDLDTWTLTAQKGDRLAAQVGEIDGIASFYPSLRLWAPDGTSLGEGAGSEFGTHAAALEVVAPATGEYRVLIGSGDTGHAGSGTYRLTVINSSDPVTVSSDDEGGPLTSGAEHTGEIETGDLDTWTFSAQEGDRLAAQVGEIDGIASFYPSLRLWAPDGTSLGEAAGPEFGTHAASIEVVVPATGEYRVLIGSGDTGHAGSGTYRLTVINSSDPVTVSPDDEGGPLTSGAEHTGEIETGDLDTWTFTAQEGDRLGAQVGEIDGIASFYPSLRLWAPDGTSLGEAAGSEFGTHAAALEVVAPATGVYRLLIGSGDTGHAGSGTYRLTVINSSDPVTVSSDDEGGPLTSGAEHTGEIETGDLDTWTFNAQQGDRIGARVSEIDGIASFYPQLRLWAPDGTSLGSEFGTGAAALDVVASATGEYRVVIGSGDSGRAGSGTYRLTVEFPERAAAAPARPNMTRSVPSPLDISTDRDVIATNVTLALLTLIVILVVAQLFNSTLTENRTEIETFFAPVLNPFRAAARYVPKMPVTFADKQPPSLLTMIQWPVLIVILTAVIYGFAEPGFGANTKSIVLALSLAISVGLITVGAEGAKAYILNDRYKQKTGLRPYPLAIAIAIANVAFCRAIGFEPGIIFGFVGVCVFLEKHTLDDKQQGEAAVLPISILIAVSVASWFAIVPTRALAKESGLAVAAFIESTTVAIFVTGLHGVTLGLIPLSFNDGHKIKKWNQLVWGLFALAAILGLWHVLINKDQSYFQILSSTVPLFAFSILVAVSVLCAAVWYYFAYRHAPGTTAATATTASPSPAAPAAAVAAPENFPRED